MTIYRVGKGGETWPSMSMLRTKRGRITAAAGAFVIVAAAAIVLLIVVPATAKEFATLHPVTGTVEIQRGGDGAFRPGTEGATLRAGDVVRTGPDGRAEIEYFDGSLTRMDEATTFVLRELASIPDTPGSKLIEGEQAAGRTFQRIVEITDSESRFDVETPTATASVRGTQYVLTVHPDGSTELWVLPDDDPGTSSVVLILEDGTEIVVEEGEGILVLPPDDVQGPFPLSDQQLNDPWVAFNQCELDELDLDKCQPEPEPEPEPEPPDDDLEEPPPPPPPPDGEEETVVEVSSDTGGGGGGGEGVSSDPPGNGGPNPPPDSDGDGIPNAEDPCPRDPTNACDEPPPPADSDGDGVVDAEDNCPDVPNPGQADRDEDGTGNACDSDRDGDGVANDIDNCPDVSNPGQADQDEDGTGDACETNDASPPETTITDGPPEATESTSATFTFTSSESESTFDCNLDGQGFLPCESPQDYEALAQGPHTFDVRATDRAGNTDATPATYSWRVGETEAITVTLTWSGSGTPSVPNDLDIHILTPNEGEVAYFNRCEESALDCWAGLDQDDTVAPGSETVTIRRSVNTEAFVAGDYVIFVENFACDGSFAQANATVTVFGGGASQTFVPPATIDNAKEWNVATLTVDSDGTASISSTQTSGGSCGVVGGQQGRVARQSRRLSVIWRLMQEARSLPSDAADGWMRGPETISGVIADVVDDHVEIRWLPSHIQGEVRFGSGEFPMSRRDGIHGCRGVGGCSLGSLPAGEEFFITVFPEGLGVQNPVEGVTAIRVIVPDRAGDETVVGWTGGVGDGDGEPAPGQPDPSSTGDPSGDQPPVGEAPTPAESPTPPASTPSAPPEAGPTVEEPVGPGG
jgi:hypothetical protein